MNKTAKNNLKGFTLIELLIVVVLLGVLSSVVMVSFSASQKRTRDINRKSDLSQFRSALESYANKSNGIYPLHAAVVAANTICAADLGLTLACPLDPKNGTAPYGYKYISDATGTKYLLYAYLESPSPSTNVYFGMCSTGITISQVALPTIASCP